jgi:hypothetical protein
MREAELTQLQELCFIILAAVILSVETIINAMHLFAPLWGKKKDLIEPL